MHKGIVGSKIVKDAQDNEMVEMVPKPTERPTERPVAFVIKPEHTEPKHEQRQEQKPSAIPTKASNKALLAYHQRSQG
jgi:predicted component of type VI protein secretion system